VESDLVAVVSDTAQLMESIDVVLQMIGLQYVQLIQLLGLLETIDAIWVRLQGLESADTLQERQQALIGRVGRHWERVCVGNHITARQGREHSIAGRARRDILREQGRCGR